MTELTQHTIEQLTNMKVASFNPIADERLEKDYDVFIVQDYDQRQFILKKAQRNEYTIANMIKNHYPHGIIPEIQRSYVQEDVFWLTTTYISGEDLTILKSDSAESFGKSLAKLASYFYVHHDLLKDLSPTITKQIKQKETLMSKLESGSVMADSYQKYLNRFLTIPKTLSHDDLLPINVLSDAQGKLKIIDWEHGRKSSYMADVARFACFYSADKADYQSGYTFLDEANNVEKFLATYYASLSSEFKQHLSQEQFYLDYQLEAYNQYLLNISHLDQISSAQANSQWESYFYKLAVSKAELIPTL